MRKYDLIISIGRDCGCTTYLRDNNLQIMSYPFDWLTNASLSTRLSLILNDFENFINIDDLTIINDKVERAENYHYDYYENCKNGIYFYHDFPAGSPLTESYPVVEEKYKRRIKRFYNDIDANQQVLFVWYSHFGRDLDNKELLNFSKQINSKFGKEIDFFIIDNDHQVNNYQITELSSTVRVCRANTDVNGTMKTTLGDERLGTKIFTEQFQLSKGKLPFIKKAARNFTYKIIGSIIFCHDKKKRKNFRRKYIRK